MTTGHQATWQQTPGRITVTDGGGAERAGLIARLPRWDPEAASSLDPDAGFRIVIVEEPPSQEVQPPPATAVCIPQERLRAAAAREAAVAHETGRPTVTTPTITGREIRLLAGGRIVAAPGVALTAPEVFVGDSPRFDLLACQLLLADQLEHISATIAVALSAPQLPQPAAVQERLQALRTLAIGARAACDRLPEAAPAAALQTIDRVSDLCVSDGPQEIAAAAYQFYPHTPALAEDVYLLRALVEMPAEAVEVLALQSALASAELPLGEADLTVDRAIAAEQLRFAGIIPEPQRLNAARTALQHFQDRYRRAYLAHHHGYWRTAGALHARLQENARKARALARLNSLTELGPPIGAAALDAYAQLLQDTSVCQLDATLDDELRYEPACPACGLRLVAEPPEDEVLDANSRLESAIHRQLARLSGAAVGQLLQRSGDARIERFLKVVQAAQISSLVDILDDDLIGYLRRFLLEARITTLLEPVLSRVQDGESFDGDAARGTLREVARVIQRALAGKERALPPGRPEGKRTSGRKPG